VTPFNTISLNKSKVDPEPQMLYTSIKEIYIISHSRGDLQLNFYLHFHPHPFLQQQDKRKKEKKKHHEITSFLAHKTCCSMEWDDTGICQKSYAWSKADKWTVPCHISVPRKLISTDSISYIIIFA
jgi:hypothetical protein